jgi:hypothetical protein
MTCCAFVNTRALHFSPWGSDILQRSSVVPVPVLIQDSIVQAILQRGLGATFVTLSAHELAWCHVIVELPHHKGALGITPLPASGMAAFYSATAHLVSWLGSLPHASEWVAGQNLADPNTWNGSALHTLKQLHDNLLSHYNCTEWAPTLVDDAPAPDAPAQGHDDDSARSLSLPPFNLQGYFSTGTSHACTSCAFLSSCACSLHRLPRGPGLRQR